VIGTRYAAWLVAIGWVLASPAQTDDGPDVSFGGQYRVNGYVADNDDGAADRQTAARLRIRQDIDVEFSSDFSTHLQMELGDTTDNLTTTEADVKMRHAVMMYRTGRVSIDVGLLPLADRFGDTLFSSDWNYNPLAVSVEFGIDPGVLRVAAGVIDEGLESAADDDTTHYQVDYWWSGERAGWNAGVSYVELSNPLGESASHWNAGIAVNGKIRKTVLSGFVMASRTSGSLLGRLEDAGGLAATFEVAMPVGAGDLSVQATHAEGAADGGGFLPVMSIVRANGYWGYTGILTVQGPTDTGFDGDSVNLSNNGYGLDTLQVKYTLPATDRFSVQAALGWFGNTRAAGRESTVGKEAMVMATLHLTPVLALDLGIAFAALGDGASGYHQGPAGDFNQEAGTKRNKNALFTRLQAEF